MTPETFLVLYFNLCAVSLAGWLHARRYAVASQSWRAVARLSISAFVLLLVVGGLCVALLVLWGLTWHGC